MEIYLLKASAILALFVITYQVLLKNETFFRLNRYFLLSGLLASLLLPLWTITEEIPVVMTALPSTSQIEEATALSTTATFWESALFWVYMAGLIFFAGVVLYQITRLLTLIRKGKAIAEDGYWLIPSRSSHGPFSFFKYIFYNPEAHGEEELELVLEHEKAHSRQWHSLDILLARAAAIVLWVNPLIWWYQKLIQQNLEYLADAQAITGVPCVKEYQYALLKVSGNRLTPALVSPFNQSLIKKRIVMLQRTQSKSIHLAKYLLILPMLAFFLMAFNREKVYVMEESPASLALSQETKSIELIIDKSTTDVQLLKMKEDLAADDIDFSYTTVRNDAKEIIDISINLIGKSSNGNSFTGSYNSDSNEPIKPMMIRISTDGGITIGEISALNEMKGHSEIHVGSGAGHQTIWVQDSGESGKEIIEIRKSGGKEVIVVDGKQIVTEEIHGDGEHKNVFVKILDEEGGSEEDIQIFTVDVDEDNEDGQTIIINTDDNGKTKYQKIIVDTEKSGDYQSSMKVVTTDGKKPLIYIDGKKANEKAMDSLDPDQIESINVVKGEKALERFGKKAKNGVIEITTKKE